MPQTKQAKKALRQSDKKATRNKIIRETAKTLRKKTLKAITTDNQKSEDMIKKTVKALDKALQKGILKKGTVARRKSRLMKAFNKSKSQK